MNQKEIEKAEAIANLRKWIKPGSTVYTILRHRSASGMSRVISVVLVQPDGRMIHPNHAASRALGYPLVNKNGSDGLRVSGCGMDMGFEVVYRLGCALWPKGDGKTITGRNGSKKPETDGGYLLRQEWL